MSGLGKRLDALEQLAEDVRRREQERVLRELAAERGVDFDRLMECYAACRERTATLRAQGLTEEQIEEDIAASRGLSVDELRAKRDELLERFG
jgi:hypothetical protein